MLIDPRQAIHHPSRASSELQTLHQPTHGNIFMVGQSSRPVLEIVDQQLKGTSSLFLGWGTRRADWRNRV